MIEPLKKQILVMKPKPKTETDSGITLIPELQQEDPIIEGFILARGKDADSELQVGQKILFGKREGIPVDSKYCDGVENCLILVDNQVRCIIGEPIEK